MRWFLKQPFIAVVLAYCAGISAAHADCIPINIIFAIAGVLLICLSASIFLKSFSAAGVCVCGLFFCAGFYSLYPKTHPNPSSTSILLLVEAGSRTLEAVITEPPEETLHRTKLKLSVRSIHDHDWSTAKKGNLLLNIKECSRRYSYGDRIRFSSALHSPKNFLNPGGFDYIRHLAYKNIYATAFLESDQSVTLIREGEGNKCLVFIESIRSRIRECIISSTQSPSRDILLALIIGEQGTIPEQTRDRFSALGITHILSISGLHVSIFALLAYGIIFNLLKMYPRLLLYIPAKKIAVFMSIFPVLGYCMIAGMATPAARSGLMVVCYLLTLLLDRPQHMLHTLFLAAFFILAVSPQSLFEISFQLSFLAVFSLIILVPAWKSLWTKKEPDPFKKISPFREKLTVYTVDSLLSSAAAMLGTAPIVACYFHTFAPSGFITNLVMVPIAGFVLVPLGLAATLLVFIWLPAGVLLFQAAGLCTDVYLNIAGLFYDILGDGMTVPEPLLWEVLFFYGLLILSAVCRTKKQWVLYGCGLLFFFAAERAQTFHANRPNDSLTVTFLDVGAGDAAVLQLPNKEVMIIDGGGLMDDNFDVGKAVDASFLYSCGIRQVDYIVLSHPHGDHAGGLPYIARTFNTQELWYNGQNSYLAPYLALMETAAKKRCTVISCNKDTPLRTLGSVTFEILSPLNKTITVSDEDQTATNNNSLVLKITYGEVSFLFTGDILKEQESKLVHSGANLSATVLKVPHHGGQASSTDEFLNAVQPSIAVVSGRSFGKRQTPHPVIKKRFEQLKIDTYVTELCGAITITTDGKKLEIKQHKKTSVI
jgi:competence protein ComEC